MDAVSFAKAIADDTRQRIMKLLCAAPMCVSDIVAQMGDLSQPTVSHHLNILKQANLVDTRRSGKQIYYSVNQDAVERCCGMLMRDFAPDRSASE